MIALFLIFLAATVTCLVTGHSLLWALLLGLSLFFALGLKRGYSVKRLWAMGCICFENPAMGIYFITDPDNYWLEIIPAR